MLLDANPSVPSTTTTTVLLQVEMPMSMDEFFAKQAVFSRGLSEITAVDLQNMRIVGIKQVSTPRRRLLLARISVDVEFVVESRAVAEEVVLKLTLARLNMKNTENGLPALKLVSVMIPMAPTTPISTPAPYNIVRVFVYRLPLTIEEFDEKRDAFQRAIALAYAVLLDRVVVKSVAKFTQPSRDTRQMVFAYTEVGVAISFSNIAHSEAVVSVSAINDALRQQGLPAVIELVVVDDTTQSATDQSSGIPTMYVWIFYGVVAATFVLVLYVCMRLGFGRFWVCCGSREHFDNNEHLIPTKVQTYFTLDTHAPVGYASEHPHVHV
jgi:hypothetical protein